jgi:hypothetical protein
MVSSEFTIVGDGWKRAGPDVVLSGLGWVSITGAGECLIKVLYTISTSANYILLCASTAVVEQSSCNISTQW